MENNNVTIKLKSNIILKNTYKKYSGDMSFVAYLPLDLLPKEYKDVRNFIRLSLDQKKEIDKQLYYAKRIVEVDNVLDESDLILLGLEPKSNEIVNDDYHILEETILVDEENIVEPYNNLDELENTNSNNIKDNSADESQVHITQNVDNIKIIETHPIIKTTLNKYPFDKCILNYYISKIVNSLSDAINYSNLNRKQEFYLHMDNLRESYRKIMHYIFELVVEINLKNYGEFFKPMNRIIVEKVFKEKEIEFHYISLLEKFHNLSGAIGHKNEKGLNRHVNQSTIDEFWELNGDKRNDILLSVPNFLNSISLTNQEKKSISNKL